MGSKKDRYPQVGPRDWMNRNGWYAKEGGVWEKDSKGKINASVPKGVSVGTTTYQDWEHRPVSKKKLTKQEQEIEELRRQQANTTPIGYQPNVQQYIRNKLANNYPILANTIGYPVVAAARMTDPTYSYTQGQSGYAAFPGAGQAIIDAESVLPVARGIYNTLPSPKVPRGYSGPMLTDLVPEELPLHPGTNFPVGYIKRNVKGNTPMPYMTEVPTLNKEQQILQSFGLDPFVTKKPLSLNDLSGNPHNMYDDFSDNFTPSLSDLQGPPLGYTDQQYLDVLSETLGPTSYERGMDRYGNRAFVTPNPHGKGEAFEIKKFWSYDEPEVTISKWRLKDEYPQQYTDFGPKTPYQKMFEGRQSIPESLVPTVRQQNKYGGLIDNTMTTKKDKYPQVGPRDWMNKNGWYAQKGGKIQSGVVVDKNKNKAFIYQNFSPIDSFPVITGENSSANIAPNFKDYQKAEKNRKDRITPAGEYLMKPMANIYGYKGFDMYNPSINMYDRVHQTYPGEYSKRNPTYYNNNPRSRDLSYGCINCRKEDIDKLYNYFPQGDTLKVLPRAQNKENRKNINKVDQVKQVDDKYIDYNNVLSKEDMTTYKKGGYKPSQEVLPQIMPGMYPGNPPMVMNQHATEPMYVDVPAYAHGGFYQKPGYFYNGHSMVKNKGTGTYSQDGYYFERGGYPHPLNVPFDTFEMGGYAHPLDVPFDEFKKGGIHIAKNKRGTFTKAAKERGKGVQEFASQVLANKGNYSPAMVKKANFARNFGGKKEQGGPVNPFNALRQYWDGGEVTDENPIQGATTFTGENPAGMSTTAPTQNSYNPSADANNPVNQNLPMPQQGGYAAAQEGVWDETGTTDAQPEDDQDMQAPMQTKRNGALNWGSAILGVGTGILGAASMLHDKYQNRKVQQQWIRDQNKSDNLPTMINPMSKGTYDQFGNIPYNNMSQSPNIRTMKNGGYVKGSTHELSEQEINNLLRQGYKIQRL